MKYLSFVFIFLFFNYNLSSQTPFHSPTLTVGSTTYNCEVIANHIRVVNQTNTVSNDWEHVLNYKCVEPLVVLGFGDIEEGIKSLFSSTRWNELKDTEKYVGIYYYFNMDGTVKEVWFRLKPTTILTPAEILAMENKIKSYTVGLDNADCIGEVSFQRTNIIFGFE